MGSVSPSDSASFVAEFTSGSNVSVFGPGELSAVLGQLRGIESVTESGVLSVVHCWSGAYHAYLKKVDKCVTPVGSLRGPGSVSSGTSVVSATTGGRYVSPSRPGYCYLLAIRREYRQAAARELGSDPAFGELASLPAGWLLDSVELDKLYVVGSGSTYHIQVVDAPGAISCKRVLDSVVAGVPVSGVQATATVGSASLEQFLSELVGRAIPESAKHDLGVVSKSAGMHDSAGKSRLRMLEAVGDAALTHVCARACLTLGKTVQEYQAARALATGNTTLSSIFVKRFPVARFAFPSGVDPGTGVVGAKTLEAVAGLVDLYFGYDAVIMFSRGLGIFDVAGLQLISGSDVVGRLGDEMPVIMPPRLLPTLQMEEQRFGELIIGAYMRDKASCEEVDEMRLEDAVLRINGATGVAGHLIKTSNMQEGEVVRGAGRHIAVSGKYQVSGCVVDATQVIVGLDLSSPIKCLSSGRLFKIPDFSLARSNSNVDSLQHVEDDIVWEVFWPATTHSVRVLRFASDVGEDSAGSCDGSIGYMFPVDKGDPFQVLGTPWIGATRVEATPEVKLKLGCFSAYGVNVVVHRGYYNICSLGLVVSARREGFATLKGVVDNYAWDCYYSEDDV